MTFSANYAVFLAENVIFYTSFLTQNGISYSIESIYKEKDDPLLTVNHLFAYFLNHRAFKRNLVTRKFF